MSDDDGCVKTKGRWEWPDGSFLQIISKEEAQALNALKEARDPEYAQLASGCYESPLGLMPRKEHKTHILDPHLITKTLMRHHETGRSVVEIKCYKCGYMRKCVIDPGEFRCLYCPFGMSSDDAWHIPRCSNCNPE
jgi:hypothetical protein